MPARPAGLSGPPAEPDQLRHQLGAGDGPTKAADLLRLAKWLEVKARTIQAKPDRLSRHPLPAIARLNDGGFVLLLQAAGERVLLFAGIRRRRRRGRP